MRLEDLPEHMQAYARAKIAWQEGKGPDPDAPTPARKPKRARKSRAGSRFDSRTEERYASELERQRLAGLIERWHYVGRRGWTLPVLSDMSYTPDFIVLRRGQVPELVEVKGAKGSRPWWRRNGSRERFKAAADAFGPWFSFAVVWPSEVGGWCREVRLCS